VSKGIVATAATEVQAPASAVWAALTDPKAVKQYMLGTDVVTDWKKGGPIVWKGEYEGRTYEDKGVILELDPNERISYSHFSPLTGKPDVPENYHTVTVVLAPGARSGTTAVTLTQDNNPDDEAREHSTAFWQDMLDKLKAVVEK
jgi:uncharacterized protein YndB with AHSA1/START domain